MTQPAHAQRPIDPPPNERPSYRPFILVIAILVAVISAICLIPVFQDHQSSSPVIGRGSVPPTSTAPAPVNETSEQRLIRIFENYWVDTRPPTSETGHGEYLVISSPYTNLASFLSDLGAAPSVYTNITTTWEGFALPPGYMISWQTYTTNTIGVNQIHISIIAHSG